MRRSEGDIGRWTPTRRKESTQETDTGEYDALLGAAIIGFPMRTEGSAHGASQPGHPASPRRSSLLFACKQRINGQQNAR